MFGSTSLFLNQNAEDKNWNVKDKGKMGNFSVYLSPPHLSGKEWEFLGEVLQSNWIAPLGPHVDAFEREMAEEVGVRHAPYTS